MDLSALRNYVREYLDIDSEELSDSLCDSFLADGFRRIFLKEKRWPWLEKKWTFSTISGVASYPIVSIGSDVGEIASIRTDIDRLYNLVWSGHTEAERRYSLSGTGGNPDAFSIWNDDLYLWPIPSSAATLEVRGYRVPIDWIAGGSGATPDCPSDFHPLIARWAIASEHERQDDTEMAAYNRQHFEDDLMILSKSYMALPTPSPLIMGGAGRRATSGQIGQPYPFLHG